MQKDNDGNNAENKEEIDEVYRRTVEIKKWLEKVKKSERKDKDDEFDR